MNEAIHKSNGLYPSIPKFVVDGRSTFPLFTDADLAKGFIEMMPNAGLALLQIKNPHGLIGIVQQLSGSGCENVGIDVSQISGRLRGRIFSIADVLEEANRTSAPPADG